MYGVSLGHTSVPMTWEKRRRRGHETGRCFYSRSNTRTVCFS